MNAVAAALIVSLPAVAAAEVHRHGGSTEAGEVLLQGTLDALELSVAFVKAAAPGTP